MHFILHNLDVLLAQAVPMGAKKGENFSPSSYGCLVLMVALGILTSSSNDITSALYNIWDISFTSLRLAMQAWVTSRLLDDFLPINLLYTPNVGAFSCWSNNCVMYLPALSTNSFHVGILASFIELDYVN